MATLDDKLDALFVLIARIAHVATLHCVSNPESELLYWRSGQYGNIAYHLEAIHHEILILIDEQYAADVSRLEEASELDVQC